MTNARLSARVVADRVHWVETMLSKIRNLPLDDQNQFFSDSRNPLACESCLRRALEALLDLGRHIMAKGFGIGIEEYKAIGPALEEHGIISKQEASSFRIFAGYRNRMVQFYHDISDQEIYEICFGQFNDVQELLDSLKKWLKKATDNSIL